MQKYEINSFLRLSKILKHMPTMGLRTFAKIILLNHKAYYLTSKSKFIGLITHNGIVRESKNGISEKMTMKKLSSHVDPTMKNSTKFEKIVKAIVIWILYYVKFPKYVGKYIINSKTYSSSKRGIITVGGIVSEPNTMLSIYEILAIILHEQFHVPYGVKKYHDETQKIYKKEIKTIGKKAFSKYKYPVDLNFSEHLSVCWNTTNFLIKIIGLDNTTKLLSNKKTPYYDFEQFVLKNHDKIKPYLEKWNYIIEL
jgi:hypothetical protein